MVTNEGIKQNWGKTEEQLNEAKRFMEEDKIDEALYFVWIAAENVVNSLKTGINGIYLKDHKEKSYILKDYFILGTLKKDYSKTFGRLSKYRLAAGFHPYTSIPKSYTKADVLKFLKEIEELRAEAREALVKRGVLK
ncbi:hypothetical protein L6303_07835 [archaeon]|nr:HEPN domain-containing protein [Nanoarchaeota archaeon]MBU4299932.1 HEPN domain-containing protein [Nanoarchaeota archaeon]MBU4452252.1 HEPN domain-containing protein [Nanoarchaeota archaeon]MCG2724625.1 hypothetical protein [archaeon]